MSLIQTVASTLEPLKTTSIKVHLRLSTATGDEDTQIESYMKVARKQAENYTRRQINVATWQMSLNSFPSSSIYLPRGPLAGSNTVTITYTDSSYDSQTVDSTFFTIDTANTVPRIYPSFNSSNENAWSDLTLASIPNVVKVTWNAGYSSSTAGNTSVPEEFKQYIKLKVGTMYKYRETITLDEYRRIPNDMYVGLLDAYIMEDII